MKALKAYADALDKIEAGGAAPKKKATKRKAAKRKAPAKRRAVKRKAKRKKRFLFF